MGMPPYGRGGVSITGASDPAATFDDADANSFTLPPLNAARPAAHVFSQRLQRQQAVPIGHTAVSPGMPVKDELSQGMPVGSPPIAFPQPMCGHNSTGLGVASAMPPPTPQWGSASAVGSQHPFRSWQLPSNRWQLPSNRWQPTSAAPPNYAPYQPPMPHSSFAHLQAPLPLPHGMNDLCNSPFASTPLMQSPGHPNHTVAADLGCGVAIRSMQPSASTTPPAIGGRGGGSGSNTASGGQPRNTASSSQPVAVRNVADVCKGSESAEYCRLASLSGIPVGPLDGTIEKVADMVKHATRCVQTGGGGFNISRNGNRTNSDEKGTQLCLRCTGKDGESKKCSWSAQYELTHQGW